MRRCLGWIDRYMTRVLSFCWTEHALTTNMRELEGIFVVLIQFNAVIFGDVALAMPCGTIVNAGPAWHGKGSKQHE